MNLPDADSQSFNTKGVWARVAKYRALVRVGNAYLYRVYDPVAGIYYDETPHHSFSSAVQDWVDDQVLSIDYTINGGRFQQVAPHIKGDTDYFYVTTGR